MGSCGDNNVFKIDWPAVREQPSSSRGSSFRTATGVVHQPSYTTSREYSFLQKLAPRRIFPTLGIESPGQDKLSNSKNECRGYDCGSAKTSPDPSGKCAQSAQEFYESREAVLLEVVAMRSKEPGQIE